MHDPKPISGSDPYEILGVNEEDTLETIEKEKTDLFDLYKSKYKRAKNQEYSSQEENRERYTEAQKALQNIDDAWQWIQNNHE